MDSSGIITTVAGGGKDAVTDGAMATAVALQAARDITLDGAGNLLIADGGLNRIFKVSPGGKISIVAGTGSAGFSGGGGQGTAAQISGGFLGLGLRPHAISWGVLLQQAQNVQTVAISPWLMYPAVPVIIVVMAFNFLGDGLRDAADPYGR